MVGYGKGWGRARPQKFTEMTPLLHTRAFTTIWCHFRSATSSMGPGDWRATLRTLALKLLIIRAVLYVLLLRP